MTLYRFRYRSCDPKNQQKLSIAPLPPSNSTPLPPFLDRLPGIIHLNRCSRASDGLKNRRLYIISPQRCSQAGEPEIGLDLDLPGNLQLGFLGIGFFYDQGPKQDLVLWMLRTAASLGLQTVPESWLIQLLNIEDYGLENVFHLCV